MRQGNATGQCDLTIVQGNCTTVTAPPACRRRTMSPQRDMPWCERDDITYLSVRRLRATRLKSSKSPKPASITASRCSRSLARKHCALPASKVANCSVSSCRASVWSSSGCAMRWISTRSWLPPTARTKIESRLID
eukprot:scaffold27847_cov65-Phaeocystis_antarctica.AAC.1